MNDFIPWPVLIQPAAGASPLNADTHVSVDPSTPGWSPQADPHCATQWGKCRTWDDYRARLGTHGSRLTALGVNFYRAPEVDWQP